MQSEKNTPSLSRLSLDVPAELKRDYKLMSVDSGKTLTQLLIEAMEYYKDQLLITPKPHEHVKKSSQTLGAGAASGSKRFAEKTAQKESA